jgi:large subunit ribosomal protein L13
VSTEAVAVPSATEGSAPKQKSIGKEVFNTVKSYTAKPADVKPVWYIVDASDLIVGRLSVKIANILMGKHRPTYTPHVACGDFVIVINAEKVRFSGQLMSHETHKSFTRKMAIKEYQHYTGYPSGRKVVTGADVLKRKPTFILHEAVRRMLPKNKLQSVMLTRLKLFAGAVHPHQAQQPQELSLKD